RAGGCMGDWSIRRSEIDTDRSGTSVGVVDGQAESEKGEKTSFHLFSGGEIILIKRIEDLLVFVRQRRT
ncbi:MAG TPA: hypothetical protein VIH54_15235, partial [Chthoniobacterales bacterium]